MQKNFLWIFVLFPFILSNCQSAEVEPGPFISYKPIVVPVALIYDGTHLRIAASRQIVTPIGTFEIGARITVTRDDDEVLLIIRDRVNDEQRVYAIEEEDDMTILLNGESRITVGGDGRVEIDIFTDTEHVIEVQAESRRGNTNASSQSVGEQARPPTDTAVPRNTRYTAYVTATRLNIRSGPGAEYEVLGQLGVDDRVTVTGRNNGGSWVQLSNRSWLNASNLDIRGNIVYLPVTSSEVGDWDSEGRPSGARLRAEEVLRIRGGAGENYRQLNDPEKLNPGDIVEIVARSRDGDWYKVNVNGKSGWVTADSRYSDVLGQASRIPVVD